MAEVLAFDALRSPSAIADGGDGPGVGGVRYLGYHATDRVRVFRAVRDGRPAERATGWMEQQSLPAREGP